MPKIYNLISLTTEQAHELFRLFTQQARDGIHFWNPDSLQNHDIQLSHAVLCRISKSRPNEVRYELLGKEIFSSKKAIVYDITGTLTLNEHTHFYKAAPTPKGKSRIAKKILLGLDESGQQNKAEIIAAAEREQTITAAAGHLKPKEIVWDENQKVAWLTRTKAKGELLEDVINKELRQDKPIFSTEERIKISLALLNALNEQVTAKKIMHRDITPRSITIDLTAYTATIFDFNLGAMINDKDVQEETSGTIPFAPPEAFFHHDDYAQTEKMDVYSIARIITLIWRGSTDSYDPKIRKEQYKINCRNEASNLNSLFTGIEEQVTEEQKTIVSNVLHEMLKEKPTERYSLTQALEEFKKLNHKNTPARIAAEIGFMSHQQPSSSPPNVPTTLNQMHK